MVGSVPSRSRPFIANAHLSAEEQTGDLQADFRGEVRQAFLQHCHQFLAVERQGNVPFLLRRAVGLLLPCRLSALPFFESRFLKVCSFLS